MLPKDVYIEVVRNTPLISIDLIIEDAESKVLLGYRKNNPAKGTWFVPGGVIRKNEHFTEAFKRVSSAETGREIDFSEAKYIGLYEHIYPKNFADIDGFGTHYVVNAFRISINIKANELPQSQHSDYWWATKDEILNHPHVHQNTKNYFNGYKAFSDY
mgnify:CR=1 FL=1